MWHLTSLLLMTWLTGYAVTALLSHFSPASTSIRCLFAFPIGLAFIGISEFTANVYLQIPIGLILISMLLFTGGAGGAILVGIHCFRYWNAHRERTSDTDRSCNTIGFSPLGWLGLIVLTIISIRMGLDCLTTSHFHSDSYLYHFPFAHIIYQTAQMPQFVSPSVNDLVYAYPPLQFMYYATTWIWLDGIHILLPRSMGFIFGLHLGILIYICIRNILEASPDIGLAGLFCLLLPGLGITSLQKAQFGAHTDLPMAFWGVSAVYFLTMDIKDATAKRWIWAGLCGGLAFWTKTTALPLVLACFVVLAFEWIRARFNHDHTWPYNISRSMKLFGIGGLVTVPFLLYNWIEWGNPIYPNMSSLFGGYLIDDEIIRRQTFHQVGLTISGWTVPFSALLSEPVFALCALFIFHPFVRKQPSLRIIYSLILVQVVIFSLMIRTMESLDYNRYMILTLPLSAILVSLFFNHKLIMDRKWNQSILFGALVLQVICIDTNIWSMLYQAFSQEGMTSNQIKVLLYDYAPLLLILVFFLTGFGGTRWTAWMVRLRMIWVIGCCLVLLYPWSISLPWRLITDPLNRPPVDWTAVPLLQPAGPWMHTHLSPSAVILSSDSRRWILPRQFFSSDSPLLLKYIEDPEMPLRQILERMAYLGITHIFTTGHNNQSAPLTPHDQSLGLRPWDFLGYPNSDLYFKLIYHGMPVPVTQSPGEFTESESFLFEIRYPPDLMSVVTSPISRPWLYNYATVGIDLNIEKK